MICPSSFKDKDQKLNHLNWPLLPGDVNQLEDRSSPSIFPNPLGLLRDNFNVKELASLKVVNSLGAI